MFVIASKNVELELENKLLNYPFCRWKNYVVVPKCVKKLHSS
jgi:hypothetical protein